MRKTLLYTIALLALGLQASAQKRAVPQKEKIQIINATIHLGNGQMMERGSLVFDKGVIVAIQANNAQDPTIKTIDAAGKHVYPGLISPYGKLGLEEVEAVRATLDYSEVGDINPNVRALVAYNTDSKIIPTVRSNGVLTTVIVPQGGDIPGMSSIVKLDAWNWEDAAIKADFAMNLNWPRMRVVNAWWAPSPEEQRRRSAAAMKEITNFFNSAKAYAEAGTPAVVNLKYEAMKPVFSGQRKLIIYASTSKEITSAVLFAKSYGIQPVILGATDALQIVDFLKENKVQLILEQPHALPSRDDDDTDMPYKRAAMLTKAGIEVCLAVEGSWQQRNLPFMAGTCAAFGLNKEEALQLVTSNTANILGVSDLMGTLAVGKQATLLISEGDLLDMRSSKVTAAFIAGAELDLTDKQKELYETYQEKYGVK